MTGAVFFRIQKDWICDRDNTVVYSVRTIEAKAYGEIMLEVASQRKSNSQTTNSLQQQYQLII